MVTSPNVNARLAAIRKSMDKDFPLDGGQVTAMLEDLRGHVLAIHDIEAEAVASIQDAMAG